MGINRLSGNFMCILFLILTLHPECYGRRLRRRHLAKETDILARYPGQDDYVSPTTNVLAVAGGTSALPCDLSSSVPNDPAILVLWYKKGVVKPIYSYDIRTGSAQHWKNSIHLGNRAQFDPIQGMLLVKKISASDAGSYKCRVDFKVNPTLSYGVNVTVIIPPHRLWIEAPSELESGSMVGPYQVGDSLNLRCESLGGKPPPEVSWWDGLTLLDDQSEITSEQQVVNILVIKRLRRKDINKRITCKANNTVLAPPLTTSVTIDMIFIPNSVQILSAKEPLSAGVRYEVSCQSLGAKPSAEIKWHIKSKTLKSFTSKSVEEGNITRSSLKFTPKVEDNGLELQCIATVPPLLDFPVVDSWKLDVYFSPEVSIRPGRSLNLSNIEENADVYFECEINANPPVYKIVWYHQGRELKHDVARGIIISNQSLVLQKIQKTSSGLYFCKASNIEGDGTSTTLEMIVKFSPICHKQEVMNHGAAPNEKVDIPCYVDSYPKPFSFTWTFNNSGESVTIPKDHVRVNGFQSTVSYTPKTELDYGTLLCAATNSVGKQIKTCVFQVFPAGRPDPVTNCSQFNLSETSVNVRCHPGFDGGVSQSFVFELYDPKSRKLLRNVTRNESVFSVEGIPAASFFNVIVYPANTKGRGENYSFKTYTLKDNAEKRTAAIKPAPAFKESILNSFLKPFLVVAFGIAMGALCITITIVSFIKVRAKRRRNEVFREKSPHEISTRESQKAPSTQVLIQSSSMSSDNEETNPDLIPKKGDQSLYTETVRSSDVSSRDSYRSSSKHGPVTLPRRSEKTKTFVSIDDKNQPTLVTSIANTYGCKYLPDFEKRNKKPADRYESSKHPKEGFESRDQNFRITKDSTQNCHNSPIDGDRSGSSYRTSTTLPFNFYQTKMKLRSEFDTIEPLLKNQRESSV